VRGATLAVLLSLAGPPAFGAESGPDDPGTADGWHGRVQVRRDQVDRATNEETTKTFVRSDNFVWGGMLSFQVAFPDEETDFSGSPFNPRLGDSKVRYRFAPRFGVSYFIEGTFPTADPAALGTGKYQLSAGVSATRLYGERRFTAQVQQVNSVAGDEARPDINYTKLDLSLRSTWQQHWLKAALNTRADWELGKTGAVGELEYGRRLDQEWSLWVLLGHLLWGEGVKATYGTKLMIGVDRWF
jgi:hypothetical protein